MRGLDERTGIRRDYPRQDAIMEVPGPELGERRRGGGVPPFKNFVEPPYCLFYVFQFWQN